MKYFNACRCGAVNIDELHDCRYSMLKKEDIEKSIKRLLKIYFKESFFVLEFAKLHTYVVRT